MQITFLTTVLVTVEVEEILIPEAAAKITEDIKGMVNEGNDGTWLNGIGATVLETSAEVGTFLPTNFNL